MMAEHNYIEYDPAVIYREMQLAYVEAGGDVVYPGDEKEMFMRGMLSVLVQRAAAVNAAMLQNTLSYAEGDALDLYGEKRGCYRINAEAATAIVQIFFEPVGEVSTIAAGQELTADGAVTYRLTEAVTVSPEVGSVLAGVECTQSGVVGNGLIHGTQMAFINTQTDVNRVEVYMSASGGREREDDDAYRERIRLYALMSNTTGPMQQYEAAARSVSSAITDAKALNGGAGVVNVYLMLESGSDADELKAAVLEKLSAKDTRPLTDDVHVLEAVPKNYRLAMLYKAENNADVDIRAAAEEYKAWQDRHIGRAFNPDKLVAAMYQAGATRVVIGSGSYFGMGDAEYTEIAENEYCSGEITLAVML